MKWRRIMSENNVEKFYGIGDEEYLYDNLDDCVQCNVDDMEESEIPEEVQVYVYERSKITNYFIERTSRNIAETLTDLLDDEFSCSEDALCNYDFDISDITLEYVKKACLRYTPYNCERTGEIITVKTKDYL